MSREYDEQLVESVAVRRRRLREAWLFGEGRFRQTLDEGVTRLFASAALAAVICAGCVGWSFIQDSRDKGGDRPSPSTSTTSPTGLPTEPIPSSPRTS